ncbi:molybdenum cofactor biosynthesis protein MoaE [Candidatus Albibeggiatoa sp. nov. NOAA]|uniref:molybdenum cofactor biosynthesis protein MoaE n=1 Tax=Candidatus Albibeggiatoa sp. nov. NOAA TaxID=3162724 RepID=UPI0033044138|nr:molybdenum cofactor biosynthesis protein MoaE [Thiotrichaceae bacterium]
MKVVVTTEPFNAWEYIQDYEQQMRSQALQWGAVTTFVGTMRDFNEGDDVQAMFLEHYSPMTENYLEKISQTAMFQWEIIDTLIVHRVGEIVPQDNIVLVAAWAAHRGTAYEASRFLIEELKHNAPFWKHETLTNGEKRWVAANTSGEAQTKI